MGSNILLRSGVKCRNQQDYEKIPTLDFRLQQIIGYWKLWCGQYCCPVIEITDIDGPGHLKNGPHYRKQAADLWIHGLGLPRSEEFADFINGFYAYGRGYNCAVVGRWDAEGKHDNHLHLQVPPPYAGSGRIDFTSLEET